jgi:predicted dehydrogenase
MDRIVTICRRNRVPLAFGLDRRWWLSYRQLRQMVADDIVGAVTSVIAYGLPNLINHGCHWYDAMLMLVGDPEPIWVSGLVDDVSNEPPDSRRRMDPAGLGQIGLSNGGVAYVTPGGSRPAFDVVGERGRLFVLNDAKEAYLWLANEAQLRPLALPPMGEGWQAGPAAVRDLVDAMQTGGTTSCDVEHARRATEIGFVIYISHAANGARVSLPATERSLRVPSFPWGNE